VFWCLLRFPHINDVRFVKETAFFYFEISQQYDLCEVEITKIQYYIRLHSDMLVWFFAIIRTSPLHIRDIPRGLYKKVWCLMGFYLILVTFKIMRRLKWCIGLHRNNLTKTRKKMAIVGPRPEYLFHFSTLPYFVICLFSTTKKTFTLVCNRDLKTELNKRAVDSGILWNLLFVKYFWQSMSIVIVLLSHVIKHWPPAPFIT
jgi:hypothetical protein